MCLCLRCQHDFQDFCFLIGEYPFTINLLKKGKFIIYSLKYKNYTIRIFLLAYIYIYTSKTIAIMFIVIVKCKVFLSSICSEKTFRKLETLDLISLMLSNFQSSKHCLKLNFILSLCKLNEVSR